MRLLLALSLAAIAVLGCKSDTPTPTTAPQPAPQHQTTSLVGQWTSGGTSIEFKPDGTFERRVNDAQSAAQISVTGTYKLEGDKLTIAAAKFSIIGDTVSAENKAALENDGKSLVTSEQFTVTQKDSQLDLVPASGGSATTYMKG